MSTDEKILDIEPWDSGDAQSSISDNIYINKRKIVADTTNPDDANIVKNCRSYCV